MYVCMYLCRSISLLSVTSIIMTIKFVISWFDGHHIWVSRWFVDRKQIQSRRREMWNTYQLNVLNIVRVSNMIGKMGKKNRRKENITWMKEGIVFRDRWFWPISITLLPKNIDSCSASINVAWCQQYSRLGKYRARSFNSLNTLNFNYSRYHALYLPFRVDQIRDFFPRTRSPKKSFKRKHHIENRITCEIFGLFLFSAMRCIHVILKWNCMTLK